MKKIISLLLFSVCIMQVLTAQTITIDDTQTANQLVQSFFANSGGCGVASNVSITGGNFSGAQSYGYFTNGGSAFPLANGIILSTGRAISAIGPNNGNNSETLTGWNGDSDLNTALNLSNTFDATILEFDFTPFTNKISFDYIFSSEQYLSNPNPNQCGFTDGFAFLIKPTGGSYQNIALVPGTNIPVSVNTIRGAGTICPANNTFYFDAFNGNNHPTSFNGQTKILKAKADVIAGNSYHIKLVIADQGNGFFDSAIFLGGGTFQSETDLGIDRLIATNNPYCSGDNIILDATQPGNNTYKWYKNGVFTGVTTPTYAIIDNTNSNVVEYKVEVMVNGSCLSTGKINAQFAPKPVLYNQTLSQCDDDNNSQTTFNLTKLNNLIKGGDTTLGDVTYFESIGGNQIANPSAYVSGPKTIFAQVYNSYGCTNFASVELQIANNIYSDVKYLVCDDKDGNSDGILNINLNQEITPLIATSFPIEYYFTSSDAILQKDKINTPVTSNPSSSVMHFWARILNGNDCISLVKIEIEVKVFKPLNFEDENLIVCSNNSLELGVDNIFNSYLWSTTEVTNSISISNAGVYSVEVTNADGCKATKKFNVQSSAPASSIDATIVDFSNNNTLTITYIDNGGDYEFSIDGVNYQDSSNFENLQPGIYMIYVRDKKGCEPTPTKEVTVLDYPKFFTPNDDGFNDFWKIQNLEKYPDASISIFNRFGKLLKQFNANSKGWDGNYLGKPLPSDDYWFILTFSNKNSIKSHFSLKR